MPSKRPSKSRSTEIPAGTELSRQLLKAQEEERRRISRELHDETGQGLMVLRFQFEMLASEASSAANKAKIEESLDLLDRTIEGLRRTIARLSPRLIEELGLVAAIRREAEVVSKRSGIHAHVELPDDPGPLPLDHDLEVALYRSVQEALHNVTRHSQAKNFTIKLERGANKVALQIADDGVGFSPRTARERGFGLTGMRERAAALGGTVKVRSQRDKGTTIRLVFPLNDETRHFHSTTMENSEHRITAA